MCRTILALAAAALIATGAQAKPPTPGDPAPVIAAEHAFAARAAEVGVAPSFLDFMADEAIVLNPDPVSARALYSARPPAKSPKEGGTLLAWWPNFAGVSRSGDLGFTTGPASVNGKPPGVFYFTVWARQADGAWKWIYDGGISADGTKAPGSGAPPRLLPAGAPRSARLRPDKVSGQVWLREDAVNAAAADGRMDPYRKALAADVYVQDDNRPPATTPAAVGDLLAARSGAIGFHRLGGRVSKAGDLAWTYGDARWNGGKGHYVRIWQNRRGAGWVIVFDQIVAN